MHNMKTLFSLLTILSLMFISCSASSVESDEDNKIADRPITPKEMQRMMGRGFDVQWAEFSKKIELYGEDEVKAIKQKGFNTARIRTKLPADETLFQVLDRCINDCLNNGIIPVLAYNALDYELNPNEMTLADCAEWWKKIAEHYAHSSHRLVFNLNIEWSDVAGKDYEAINLYNQTMADIIRQSNPTRILILSPARLSSPAYLDQMVIPTSCGDYVMAEWHLYAAGPSKDPNSKKYWLTGTEEEMQSIRDIINLGVEWQERTGIPTWVGAWMPGNYNKGNDYTVEEQSVFASFMKSELERHDLPWAVNSLDKFYDIYNNCWYDDMLTLIDVLAK